MQDLLCRRLALARLVYAGTFLRVSCFYGLSYAVNAPMASLALWLLFLARVANTSLTTKLGGFQGTFGVNSFDVARQLT